MESVLLNAAGHRRSPATMPGYHRGRPPRNKGEEYPADPPTIEEIVAVVRAVGDRSGGYRLRALEPRHHKHLSAGHRQQRDHQHRPWEAVADDLRQRRPPDEALAISATRVGRPHRADPTPHPRLARSRDATQLQAKTCSADRGVLPATRGGVV
jgi:hypothetical protein